MLLASLLPFACVLFGIAILPVVAPRLWHHPMARAATLLALASPAIWLDATTVPAHITHAVDEYVSFMLLLAALYALAAGIVLAGPFDGRPLSNTLLLLSGAVLANAVGTTGASMLLLPPFLRANRQRQHTAHLVVFFIFLVSNLGGLLTPLGDPPLFLGYLHGVPFAWTLRLWPEWALGLGLLGPLFWWLDRRAWAHESAAAGAAAQARASERWRVAGAPHVAGLVLLVAILALGPSLGLGIRGQQGAMLLLAALAWRLAPAAVRAHNHATGEPLVEVATVFLPLFLAMPQALGALGTLDMGALTASSERLFWATGILSSVLDNAPCYLAMAALAAARAHCSLTDLSALAAEPSGALALAAIAHGAVSMGAMTYIGNGPNLMVRAGAAAAGLRPPSFFGYIGWSVAALLPCLVLVRAALMWRAIAAGG